jgi:hypothetical protein
MMPYVTTAPAAEIAIRTQTSGLVWSKLLEPAETTPVDAIQIPASPVARQIRASTRIHTIQARLVTVHIPRVCTFAEKSGVGGRAVSADLRVRTEPL